MLCLWNHDQVRTGGQILPTCRKTQTPEEREEAFAIRRTVFIDEQGVPEDIEYDEFEDSAIHFICHVDGKPVGAGRLSILDHKLKVERIAILKEYRSQGLGKLIVGTVLKECSRYPGKLIGGHAQLIAREFYEELGFRAIGEVFDEAGIPHIEMVFEQSE